MSLTVKLKRVLQFPDRLIQFSKCQPITMTLIIVSYALVLLFVVFPLLRLVWDTLWVDGEFSLTTYSRMFDSTRHRATMVNTLRLGVTVAFLSTALAIAYAYGVTRRLFPFPKFFHMFALLPIVSPPFVFALSSILLFGRRGYVSYHFLGLETAGLYGFGGLVLVQTLTFFPIAYLVLLGLIKSLDPSLEDAAANIGSSPFHRFRRITLPLLAPGIGAASLLVFIQSLADFSNPRVLGGSFRVLSEQVYVQYVGGHDPAGGTILAMWLLGPSILAFVVQKYWIRGRSFVTVTGKPSVSSEIRSSALVRIGITVVCGITLILVLLLYTSIVGGSFFALWGIDHTLTLRNYRYVFNIGANAIQNSLTLSFISAPIAGFLGILFAFLVVRKRFAGRRLLELLTLLTFAVPGTVAGISYILAFNVPPLVLTGTATILIIALVFRNMPVGIQSGIAALQQIDESIEEASINLGASPGRTFWKITVPLIRPALFSGIVYSFVRAMTAVSGIIFLVSARWPLMTSAVLMQVEEGRFGTAAAYSTLLMIFILLMIALMNFALGTMTGYKSASAQQMKPVVQNLP